MVAKVRFCMFLCARLFVEISAPMSISQRRSEEPDCRQPKKCEEPDDIGNGRNEYGRRHGRIDFEPVETHWNEYSRQCRCPKIDHHGGAYDDSEVIAAEPPKYHSADDQREQQSVDQTHR